MEAIVLAGGFGTRLREVVPDLPKPMVPVDGRPFLEILLSLLASKGVKRVVLSLGFMAEKIINHFGSSYGGMELVHEVESHPLGTGGAIRSALARCLSDHVYVFNGDTYLDLDLGELERLWCTHRTPLIVVRAVPDTQRFGRVEIVDGRITGFHEKGTPGPGLINAGCYVLSRHLLDDFPLGHSFSLETGFFAAYLERIRVDAFVTHGQFIDIGVPEDYAAAQLLLARKHP